MKKVMAAALAGLILLSACSKIEEPVIRRRSNADVRADVIEKQKSSLDPSIYPEDLIKLYDKNPEARDFVLDFPKECGRKHNIDLDQCVCDEIPHLLQWDKRWGYESYNGNYFALTGCGPTCLSMVTIYLTGDSSYTPLWMAEFLDSHGYSVEGVGTAWSIFDDGIGSVGLYGEKVDNSIEDIEKYLGAGIPMIASMGPGDFTQHGHFVVFTSCKDGRIMVLDPNSNERTREWDYDELEDQIAGVWAMTIR